MLSSLTAQKFSRFQCLLLTSLWISLLPNAAPLIGFTKATASVNMLQAVGFVLGGWVFALAITHLLVLILSQFLSAFNRYAVRAISRRTMCEIFAMPPTTALPRATTSSVRRHGCLNN
jgi:hypothetical protein